jgi:predicted peptidase
MFSSFILVVALIAFVASSAFAADPALKSYNIDDDITVSGLSSGGFMAVQVIIYF